MADVRGFTPSISRGRSILSTKAFVSAAAGSGKTAELAERIINIVQGKADVDRMLVVTFTNGSCIRDEAQTD